MLQDSLICERRLAAYGRILTAEKANRKTSTFRRILSFKAHGPVKADDFIPAEIHGEWMGIIAPDDATGAIKYPQRQNLAVMKMRATHAAHINNAKQHSALALPCIFLLMT